MRASLPLLFVAGAAAADLGAFKIMSTATGCKFGRCFTSYVVSGAERNIDGVTYPEFAARCKTLSSCTNALEGSTISSEPVGDKLTITQTVISNGAEKSIKAIADWDETTETYVEAPIVA